MVFPVGYGVNGRTNYKKSRSQKQPLADFQTKKKVKNHDKSHGLWGFFLLKLT
jgi:hypothetical protein